jgi:two-component system nitrate/nitrite response regulator NarP
MARILIADDHPFFLDGLEKFLASAGHEVVARASHAREVYALADQEKPDLLILDVMMPPSSGIEILKTLRARGNETPIVLVTADIGASEALEAIRHDVNGVVVKHSAPDLLMRCVDAALAGESWIDRDIMERALKESMAQGGQAAPGGGAENLTQRERGIVMLVAQGLRNREIAEQINVTEGTIKVHLHNIYRKLAVPSRTKLALIVKEQGWL